MLIDNPNLAEAVEHEMRQVEDYVFERVLITTPGQDIPSTIHTDSRNNGADR